MNCQRCGWEKAKRPVSASAAPESVRADARALAPPVDAASGCFEGPSPEALDAARVVVTTCVAAGRG